MNKATLRRGAATYSTPHSRAITSPVLTSVRGWKLVEFYAKPLNAAEIFNAYPRRLVGEIRTQHRTTADRRRNSEKRHHLKSGIRVQVGRLAHVVERHVKWSQRATTLIRTVPAGRGAGSEPRWREVIDHPRPGARPRPVNRPASSGRGPPRRLRPGPGAAVPPARAVRVRARGDGGIRLLWRTWVSSQQPLATRALVVRLVGSITRSGFVVSGLTATCGADPVVSTGTQERGHRP